MKNQCIGISAIEIALPEKRMNIQEMARSLGEGFDQLEKSLGLTQKPVLNNAEDITSLALKAAKQLLYKNHQDPDQIDFIIHASCGLQDKQLWSTAAKIQKEIGAQMAFSFDIQNGCNSGNLALELSNKLLSSDDSKECALIVVSDALSDIVDYKNPLHKCIFNFSDAASAILIRKNNSRNRLISFMCSTNAVFADSIYKFIRDDHVWMNDDPEEDKMLIKEYEERYVNMIKATLEKANLKVDDLNQIIMNQGDHKLIDKLSKRLNFPALKIFRSHQNLGHLGGTDIFYGLKKVLENGSVKVGDFVVLASSAIGFSWGASVIQI